MEYIRRGSIHHVEEVDSYVCFPFLHVVYSNVGQFSLGPLVFKHVFKFQIGYHNENSNARGCPKLRCWCCC